MTSHATNRLKHPTRASSHALDLFAIVVNAISVLVLLFLVYVGAKTVRAFKEGRQALIESASILDAIVRALSFRMEQSELALEDLKASLEEWDRRANRIQGEHGALITSQLNTLRYVQDLMSNDRRLIQELAQLKTRFLSLKSKQAIPAATPTREPSVHEGDILSSLAPTERQTIEILVREGAKAAPELGRKLHKSREHTARPMKKLYLDGYVDRESNHPPYRYKVNEKVRRALETADKMITERVPEKA